MCGCENCLRMCISVRTFSPISCFFNFLRFIILIATFAFVNSCVATAVHTRRQRAQRCEQKQRVKKPGAPLSTRFHSRLTLQKLPIPSVLPSL